MNDTQHHGIIIDWHYWQIIATDRRQGRQQ
jgi:hypothetical protein